LAGYARLREARADALFSLGVPHFGAREIGELEIVEEDLHELLARQREDEFVFAAALAALVSPAAAARAVRPRNSVAGDVLAIARQHEFAIAAAAEAERRLGDVLLRHPDLAAALHIGQAPLAHHLLDRGLDLRLVPAQESLAIDGALAASVGPSVDELEHRQPRTVSPVPS
jgi:hypothetical protein